MFSSGGWSPLSWPDLARLGGCTCKLTENFQFDTGWKRDSCLDWARYISGRVFATDMCTYILYV